MPPSLLSLDEALEIHRDQLVRYGGAAGAGDLGLLQSTLAQPPAKFGGRFQHADVYEMGHER
jgi:death-on-curing protein